MITIQRKHEHLALILVLVAMTIIAATALLGQEQAQADRDDLLYQLEVATSQPTPVRTIIRTKTPPPMPPKTVIKTVTKTIEVERPAERSSRSIRESRTKSSSGMADWKQRFWDEGQVWAQRPKTRAVIMCESTNRVDAVSATGKYRGLYQMDKGKWASYGGLELAPRPDLASRAEQNYVAYRVYVGNGWSPWSCA